MIAAPAYIVRETRLSMIINGVLSAAFYLLFFGLSGPVAVWGLHGLALDFAPQSFAITLMSVLVPGALTQRRLAAGIVARHAAGSTLPRNLFARALLLASLAAVVGTAVMAAILTLLGSDASSWGAGALIKVGYGVLLARIVTPVGLMAALRRDGAGLP